MKQPTPNRELTKSTAGSRPGKTPARTRATASGAVLSSIRPQVHPKWAWHYRVLLKVRERLLLDRGEQRREAAEPLEPHSMDIADSATDEFDHDMALSQLSAEQDALFEIEEALKRIVTGGYGVCEVTGQPIPAARLRAIPWTRFSKNAEEVLENIGAIGHAHIEPAHSIRGSAPGGLAETDEPAEAPQEQKANDEAPPHVYSPPGRHLHDSSVGKHGGAKAERHK